MVESRPAETSLVPDNLFKTLYITGRTTLYKVRLDRKGARY